MGLEPNSRGGVVFDSSTGFRMPDGSLLSPDASWVRRSRWEALTQEQRDGFAPLCPDAVFAIRSPSDRRPELEAKMQAYLTNGATLAVLIDPEERTVRIYLPNRAPQVLQDPRTVPLAPRLPGLVLDLQPILSP